MSRVNRMIELAKRASLQSPSRFRVGCIIAKGSKVTSRGFNDMCKTHPKSKSWGNYLHAEARATIGLTGDNDKAVAYIVRLKRDGSLGYSRPCENCEIALKSSGIRTIYYSTDKEIQREDL